MSKRTALIRSRWLTACATTLIAAACGPDEPRAPTAYAPVAVQGPVTNEDAELEVSVIDRLGAPVGGALVELSVEGSGDGLRAVTAADGVVRFRGVTATRSVAVWVSREDTTTGFAQLPPAAVDGVHRTVIVRTRAVEPAVSPRAAQPER